MSVRALSCSVLAASHLNGTADSQPRGFLASGVSLMGMPSASICVGLEADAIPRSDKQLERKLCRAGEAKSRLNLED